MDFEFWDRCPRCGKILVSESNLWKLRGIIGGATIGGGVLAAAALPLLGFGAGGVAAGSAAAAWQSSIGSVAAGSLFAVLQSLGATGLGILLFGSVGAGLGLLSSSAAALGWCECTSDNNIQQSIDNNTIDKIDKVNSENVVKEVVTETAEKVDKDVVANIAEKVDKEVVTENVLKKDVIDDSDNTAINIENIKK